MPSGHLRKRRRQHFVYVRLLAVPTFFDGQTLFRMGSSARISPGKCRLATFSQIVGSLQVAATKIGQAASASSMVDADQKSSPTLPTLRSQIFHLFFFHIPIDLTRRSVTSEIAAMIYLQAKQDRKPFNAADHGSNFKSRH